MLSDVHFVRLLLAIGGVLILGALWAAQRSKHPFDLRDTLMDPASGKASLNALILAMMAALATWVVIDRENDGRDDVGSILSLVLGIFVVARLGAQGINKFGGQPDAGSTVEQTVTRKETTTIPAPPVPDLPPMPEPLIGKPKAKR